MQCQCIKTKKKCPHRGEEGPLRRETPPCKGKTKTPPRTTHRIPWAKDHPTQSLVHEHVRHALIRAMWPQKEIHVSRELGSLVGDGFLVSQPPAPILLPKRANHVGGNMAPKNKVTKNWFPRLTGVNSPTTLIGVGHHWMVSTSTGCNQWLSLAKPPLKVPPC